MSTETTIYLDDPDRHVDYQVTDAEGGDLDWTAEVEVGGVTVTGVWQGAQTTSGSSTVRTLRVPLTDITGSGWHAVRLVVPSGNDVNLGRIYLTA